MRKFRNLPAVFTLVAGFIACVAMIMNKYSLKDFLWILVCVMAGFYLIGTLVRLILDKICRKEEEKQQELKKQQEEQEKEQEDSGVKNEEDTANQPEKQ